MRWTSWLLLVVLAAYATLAAAAQDDPRLPALFDELKVVKTTQAAQAVEQRIWNIWMHSGRADMDKLMREGTTAMAHHHLHAALRDFDQVVKADPGFAEGWNKRATVRWLLDDLAGSLRDIQRTLALEPRHFGALSGMGLILLEEGDYRGALRAFEAVLAIDPLAPGVRQRVDALRKKLGERQA